MRRFVGPAGAVSRLRIESQALKDNLLGDASERAVYVYVPAGSRPSLRGVRGQSHRCGLSDGRKLAVSRKGAFGLILVAGTGRAAVLIAWQTSAPAAATRNHAQSGPRWRSWTRHPDRPEGTHSVKGAPTIDGQGDPGHE